MTIRFSGHALDRMRERGISKLEVRKIIAISQKRIRQSNGNIECVARVRNKLITVVYSVGVGSILVVTAWKN